MGTQGLFSPIGHIMSYRCILLLADDGQVVLEDAVVPPARFEPFPDPVPQTSDAALMRECSKLAARGMRDGVLPSLRTGSYHGVGQRAVGERSGVQEQAMLLPAAVRRGRRVRLFTRRSCSDPLWREQLGWMKSADIDRVNDALAAVGPYKMHPGSRKKAYGYKAQNIQEQYTKKVPRECVPDRFGVPTGGCSGVAVQSWQQTTMSAKGDSSRATTTRAAGVSTQDSQDVTGPLAVAVVSRRKMLWSAGIHAQPLVDALLGAPFNGALPKKHVNWCTLASRIPASDGVEWGVQTIKRHAKSLAKGRLDILT